jgi:hypothetical protein
MKMNTFCSLFFLLLMLFNFDLEKRNRSMPLDCQNNLSFPESSTWKKCSPCGVWYHRDELIYIHAAVEAESASFIICILYVTT